MNVYRITYGYANTISFPLHRDIKADNKDDAIQHLKSNLKELISSLDSLAVVVLDIEKIESEETA